MNPELQKLLIDLLEMFKMQHIELKGAQRSLAAWLATVQMSAPQAYSDYQAKLHQLESLPIVQPDEQADALIDQIILLIRTGKQNLEN